MSARQVQQQQQQLATLYARPSRRQVTLRIRPHRPLACT